MDQEKLKQFIDESAKILITSHISPDPDAVCSSLLLGETLKYNYPGKEVEIVLEEEPIRDISFLENYKDIRFSPIIEALERMQPDLFIVVDANNFSRCSRIGGDKIRSYINLNKKYIKTAIIDHHEPDGKDTTDIYINSGYPAATQEIYDLVFNKWSLKKPAEFSQTALLGIISDTVRFKFNNPKHRETFTIVSDLIDSGANIEELEHRLDRYNKDQLEALANLIKNLKITTSGYNYSYIDDDFSRNWQAQNKSVQDLKAGCEIFVNEYVRNLDGNSWGFIIYPEFIAGPGVYSVSLRSMGDIKDVAEIAGKLGGGGHKPAAGTKLKAASALEALKIVTQAI